jgi:biopolymer transport protein ExbD
MARRHHYRRRSKELTELDVTTFLNLMVVLVPFLLITAVFSRITIVELDLPSTEGNAAESATEFRLEVVIREQGLELTNGSSVIAALPKTDGHYDLDSLADYVLALKKEYPDVDSASVLLEPQIEYDHLIQVMDVVRSADLPPDHPQAQGTERPEASEAPVDADAFPQQLALFTQISVGAAP